MTSEPSRLRRFLWPIYGQENKKFMPMALIMFLTLFNYTILRNVKDALIVPAAGPEVIPFLKSFVILPFSVLVVTFYTKLTNLLSREKIYYSFVTFFLVFFLVFSFYLYPNRDIVHPSPEFIQNLKTAHPHFQHIISIWGVWSLSMFYVLSELWNSVVLLLLFWQFANEITRTQEARRFYTMFSFVAHTALLLGGYTVNLICEDAKLLAADVQCEWYLTTISIIVGIGGLGAISLYRWVNTKVITNPLLYDGAKKENKQKGKLKLSMLESIAYIIKSRYLGLIAILIISYGIIMNLTGLLWRRQIKLQYPTVLEYSGYMADFYMITGSITVVLIYLLKRVVDKFGWFQGAIITPLTLLVTCAIFFMLLFFKDLFEPLSLSMGVTPLMMSVLIATGQQVFSKSAKYALFDPTKEMTYIPLDPELKAKGKAAVDVVGYSFSKAAGGYIAGGLLVLTAASDVIVVAPFISLIVFLIIAVWIFAVFGLNKRYAELLKTHTDEQQEAKVAAASA